MRKLFTSLIVMLFVTTKLFAGTATISATAGKTYSAVLTEISSAVTAGNTDITVVFDNNVTWGTSGTNIINLTIPSGVTKLTFTSSNTPFSATIPILYVRNILLSDALMTGGIIFNGVKILDTTASNSDYFIQPVTAQPTYIPKTVTFNNCWIQGHRCLVYDKVLATAYTKINITNNYIKNILGSGIINSATGSIGTIIIRNNTFNNVGGNASGANTDYFVDYRAASSATSVTDFSNNTVYYPGVQGRGIFRYTTLTTGTMKQNNNLFSTGNATSFAVQLLYANFTTGTSTSTDSTSYYSNKMTLGTNKGNFTASPYAENSPSNLFVDPTNDNFTINDPNFVAKTKVGNPNNFYPATINVTGGTIVNLDYNVTSGPSTAKTFTFNSYALRSAVVLQAPVNFEISTDDITYKDNSQTISLGSTGDLSSQTIYVRLKAGLAVGSYSGSVTLTTTGTSKTASVSGSVNNPLTPLDKPTGLSTSGASYTSFQANWGAVTGTGLASYTLRLISNGSTVSTVSGVDKNATSYTFSSLTPGTTYSFALTAIGDGVNNNSSVESDESGSVTLPLIYLFTSVSDASAGTVTKSPNNSSYSSGASVQLTATKNFGYAFVNWIDSVSGSVLSSANPYTVSMTETKHIKAVFSTIETYTYTVNISGSSWGQVSLSPAPTNGKYETGTSVTMTVVSNAVTAFNYWENNSTSTSRTITVDGNKVFTAYFDEIPFITGWDFRVAEPKSARTGDYYSSSSNKGTISLYEQNGTAVSWLSHTGWNSPSTPCAIKWTAGASFATNQRYFQASFKTTGYQNIQVKSQMSSSYQYYQNQKLQASLDGTNYTDLKSLNITSTWQNLNDTLPSDYNDKAIVYIRWVANTSSTRNGNASDNDGTSLTNVFVYADPIPVVDTIAPVLVSSVPAEGISNATASGNIVLTFNERVKAGSGSCTLGGTALTPSFGSKTVTFPYSKLAYNTDYSFTVPAGAITDIAGNPYTGITLNFHTMNRPTPTAKVFDAVIASDGSGDYTTIQAAIDAAPTGRTQPWLIFVKNGTYNGHVDIPSTKPYINMIGQSRDSVIISAARLSGASADSVNVYSVDPGASVVVKAANCYFENICFENKYGYDHNSGPQALALYTTNDRVILNNCWLRSYQDTYLTTYGNIAYRHYLKNCRIEGAVDFIYGGGDVFFDRCTIYCKRASGGYIVAPSHQIGTQWGYVFSNCTIDGPSSSYITYMGRPWTNSPKASFFNPIWKIQVYDQGWYYKMGAIPSVFADYNPVDGSGNPLDTSQRISDYQYDSNGSTVTGTAKKSFTDEEAAQYSYENVTKGSDNWDPRALIEPTEAPANVTIGNDGNLNWDVTPYAICYTVIKNNKVLGFTTGTTYSDPSYSAQATYKVIAVAESGALSSTSAATLSSRATDKFRSKSTGNASDASSWESSSDNSTWIAATSAPTVLASSVTVLDGHTITVNSNLIVSSLTLNAGSNLNINSDSHLTVTTTFVNNGTLNLLSLASGTATILTPATISGSGATNVQQYLTAGRNWYISSPVSGATSAVFNAATSGNSVYWYDELHGSTTPWPLITDNSTTLDVMKGYVYNPASTGVVTFSGALNTGTQAITVNRTSGQTKEGFNLVGNPFASYLDWSQVSRSNLIPSVWYRTKSAPAPITGISTYVFDTYNATSGISTGNGAKPVTKMIPPMQAFWVRVANGKTEATVSVSNAHRGFTDLPENGFKVKSESAASSTYPLIRLNVSNGIFSDQTVIYFTPDAANGFDDYDSPKMFNNSASVAEIFTKADGENLAVNGLKSLNANQEIPLGFNTEKASNFSIKAAEIKNMEGIHIFLRDNLLNTETELTNENDYSFTSDATTTTSRFTVVFRSASSTTGIGKATLANVHTYCNRNGQITISSSEGFSGNDNVSVYNVAGQKLTSTQLIRSTTILDTNFPTGIYVVTLNVNGEKKSERVIVK